MPEYFNTSPISYTHFFRSISRDTTTISDSRQAQAKDSKFLRQVERISGYIGITRIGDISHIYPHFLPAYRSCRPYGAELAHETMIGVGITPEQAKLQCLLRQVENACVAKHDAFIIHGSYSYLSASHQLLNPALINESYSPDTILDWVQTFSLRVNDTVLVPADTIHFPSSEGLSASSSHAEAAEGSLLDLIKHHIMFLVSTKKAKIYEMQDVELTNSAYYNIRNYFIETGWEGVCAVLSVIRYNHQEYLGFGVSVRSLSEAENMAYCDSFKALIQDRKTGISFNASIADAAQFSKKLKSLRSYSHAGGYNHVVSCLRKAGYNNIILADLTKRHIGIPVVKALIAGMSILHSSGGSSDQTY